MKVMIKVVKSKEDIERFFDDIFKEIRPKINKKEEVLLKPNFVLEDLRCVTNPFIVKSFAKYLSERGYKVSIGDGGYFKDTADNIKEKYLGNDFRFYNFSKGEFINKTIENPLALESIPVNVKSLKFRDNFISFPKLKVHTLAKVSLSLKNNMGFLKKPANFMHKGFDEKIVDLLSIFKPKLIVIEGIRGAELTEMICKEVSHGIMIAADNVVAADVIASYLMGFNPNELKYLRLAERLGYGDIDMKSYDIIFEGNLESIRKRYRVI